MVLNVGKEIAALERMTVSELRERYEELFNETTQARNRIWLIRRIIWRMQSLQQGGLSERAIRQANELANCGLRRRASQSCRRMRQSVPRLCHAASKAARACRFRVR
jgi:hypothetical protein